jgi:hypothetical protein
MLPKLAVNKVIKHHTYRGGVPKSLYGNNKKSTNKEEATEMGY